MSKKSLLNSIIIASLIGLTVFQVYPFNNENVFANERENTQLEIQDYNKEEIHYKMLNTLDYFKFVKGSFTVTSQAAGYTYTTEYQINTKNPKSKVKVTSDTVASQESVYDGEGNYTTVDFKNKKFIKHIAPKQDEIVLESKWKGKAPKTRYSKDEKGEKIYDYRADPTFMGLAQASIFPQDIALGFLEDYNKWEISSLEELNGLETIVISGELNDYYQEKHQAKTFKLWVHIDTGILLKKEEYNEQGEATEILITNKIKLNDEKSLGEIKAHTKPEGYKDSNY